MPPMGQFFPSNLRLPGEVADYVTGALVNYYLHFYMLVNVVY